MYFLFLLQASKISNNVQNQEYTIYVNAVEESLKHHPECSFQNVETKSESVNKRKRSEDAEENSAVDLMYVHSVSDCVGQILLTPDEKSVSCITDAKVKITVSDVSCDNAAKDARSGGIHKASMCLSISAPHDLEPLNLKPKLHGRKLTQLPPIAKDFETSNLCSIV